MFAGCDFCSGIYILYIFLFLFLSFFSCFVKSHRRWTANKVTSREELLADCDLLYDDEHLWCTYQKATHIINNMYSIIGTVLAFTYGTKHSLIKYRKLMKLQLDVDASNKW